MKKAKFFSALAAMLMAVTVVGACASLTACGSKKGVLTVATNCEFEPFEYLDDNGKPTGIDIDIVTEIAKELGMKVSIKDMAFESVVGAVGSGAQDLGAAGLTVDDERKKSVDFTQTYFNSNQVVIAKAGDAILSLTEVADVEAMLKDKRIGVQNGTTGYKYCSGDSDDYEGITDKTTGYASGALAVAALINGQVDYVVIDAVPASALVKANPTAVAASSVVLTGEEYAYAVKKGNTELLDKVNAAMTKLKENGKIEEIFNKYGLKSGLTE